MKKLRRLQPELLEDRRMLHGEGPLPSITFTTNFGDITIELFNEEAPATVENFLNYVEDGDYQNAIFHRLAADFVLQGGGFNSTTDALCQTPCSIDDIDGTIFDRIPTDDPVVNEFGRSNLRGTVAMAKLGSSPDSATNQFFVNLDNNSANLDAQNGGFTVFGQVTDMTVPDIINSTFSTQNISSVNGAFTSLPVLEDESADILEMVRVQSVSGNAVLEGTVFNDVDNSGSQNTGDGGLGQATVFLDSNNNGTLDSGEQSTATNGAGEFHFEVGTGSYNVRSVAYGADYQLTTGSTSFSRTVRVGELGANLDFGYNYTGTAWHNDPLSTDVDGINGTSPIDALLVINELNNREISDSDTGQLPATNASGDLTFLDVVVDGVVSPIDALFVINALNSNTSQAPLSSQFSASDQTETVQSTLTTEATGLSAIEQDDEATTSLLDQLFANLGDA